MVSLVDIYNVKESTLNELKSNRNPARGNKSKDREKDFYFIDPLLWMCKPDCITLIDDGVIYHDNNHLNKLGSLYFKDQFALDLANSLRQ